MKPFPILVCILSGTTHHATHFPELPTSRWSVECSTPCGFLHFCNKNDCIFQVVSILGGSGNFSDLFFYCFCQDLCHLFVFFFVPPAFYFLLLLPTAKKYRMFFYFHSQTLSPSQIVKRKMSEVNERQFFLHPLEKLKIWPLQEI